MATDMIESPLARFSEEELEQLAAEFDKIHDEVFDDLGDRDRRYITSMIALHRRLLVLSRVILLFSKHKPAWAVGTAGLSLAKILENMEIGHNVMHGQWDWMNDPQIHSSTWDWDTASTKEAWKHSHNYIHHTYTNIRGKDKDLGYEIMRIDPHQKWHPVYLFQPVYNVLLAFLFEWGVAFHDMDIEAIRRGEKSQKEALEDLKGIAGKARLQITKDYIAFPLLSGVVNLAIDAALTSLKVTQETRRSRLRRTVSKRMGRKKTTAKAAERVVRELVERRAFRDPFKATVTADATANIIRNVWAYAIIFCGHFPDQCYTFSQEEVENETRGGWYVRQLTGAANIDGSALFHVISGNLGYQVEHHLYPDMPSSRYGEIAPRVRAVCEKWGLPYNTGPFLQQLGMVQRTILRLALPGGKPRPKPGPYQGPLVRGSGEGDPRSNGHRTPAGAGVGS